MLELSGCCEDRGLANNRNVKPELRKCVVLKCGMNLLAVLVLSVKNGPGSAISRGLGSASREVHPILVMLAVSYFMFIEI